MRKFAITAATVAAVGASVLGGVAAATPASATPAVPASSTVRAASHLDGARADWIQGSKAISAETNRYFKAAGAHLAKYGSDYVFERKDLNILISIPLTSTTKQQRADATHAIQRLNLFFGTPGLYGVAPDRSHLAKAREDWVTGKNSASVDVDRYLGAAQRQLAAYGNRFGEQRQQLQQLIDLPLTGLTKTEQARAARNIHALNAFFRTD